MTEPSPFDMLALRVALLDETDAAIKVVNERTGRVAWFAKRQVRLSDESAEGTVTLHVTRGLARAERLIP